LDRGESLSHMVPFSFSVGERKIMNQFVVTICFFLSLTGVTALGPS
jgi:hypothetical protein